MEAASSDAADVRAASQQAHRPGAETIVLIEPYSNDFKFVNVDGKKEGAGDYYLWQPPSKPAAHL